MTIHNTRTPHKSIDYNIKKINEVKQLKKLTTEQSFEYYLSSLCMLGLHTINLSDEEIEYEIFEELAIDYPAALSPYTRELLVDNDIIDRGLSLLSKQLQTKLFELDGGILW